MNEPITDGERLEALERYVMGQPLVLWRGDGIFPGGRLSGLSIGMRGIRGALDVLVLDDRRTHGREKIGERGERPE